MFGLEILAYGCIFGIIKNMNCYVSAINGMEEHIHILCDFPRTITVADLINKIKTSSTKWMKEKGGVLQQFHRFLCQSVKS